MLDSHAEAADLAALHDPVPAARSRRSKTPRGTRVPARSSEPEPFARGFTDREVRIAVSRDADYETLLRFLHMAPIGLVETNIAGDIELMNPLSAQLLAPLGTGAGISNLFDAIEAMAPDLRERAANFAPAYGMVHEGFQMQVEQGVKGKHDAQVLSLTLLKLDATHLMAVLSDVSASVQRERDLRESQAWVNTMVTGISDYATLLLDAKGIIQAWNPTITRISGHALGTVEGRSYDMFYPEDAITAHASNTRLQDADLHGWTLDEGWRTRADGTRFWGSCLIAPLAGTDPSHPEEHGYSLIIRDISDRKEVNEALRRSVSYDHLTGLANRRAFFDAAESEMERWQRTRSPLSLMAIDADHFKAVNDTYGHPAGDAVLRHLAAGIAAASRTMDFVARFGGEEFVVLLPSTSIEGAEVVARRLLKSVAAQVVEVDGKRIRYTVSAGIAVMEPGMSGLDELMKRADSGALSGQAPRPEPRGTMDRCRSAGGSNDTAREVTERAVGANPDRRHVAVDQGTGPPHARHEPSPQRSR
ncbi:MAG: diguanylate cyclase [Gemmatimonadaceae bacterium]|nr:diguanylate cyclase [Gemmatimonadaceae bacterium]